MKSKCKNSQRKRISGELPRAPDRPGTRRSFDVKLAADVRLDVFLADLMAREFGDRALSRSQIKKEIESGHVTFAGKVLSTPGAKIRGVGAVEFTLYDQIELRYEPDSSIEVIYEDAALIVINKPAGLSVHPGAGRSYSTLVNKLLPKLANTDRVRPGIVHRLDKDTTGLLVVAKTVQAHAALAAQFAARTIERRYQALVLATPRSGRVVMDRDAGTINAALTRVEKKIVMDEAGRRAVTHWTVLERLGYGAVLEFKLETGRTHQIRVHAVSIKSPVIGDRTYGDFSALPAPLYRLHHAFGRQALHAHSLGFTHPNTQKELYFSTPPPTEHLALVEQFRRFASGSHGVGKTATHSEEDHE